MRRYLMMVSLLGLSAVSALAQPAPEFFKLRSSTAQSEVTSPGTCQPILDTIASFAPDFDGKVESGGLSGLTLRLSQPNRASWERPTLVLRTQSRPAECIATLICTNPKGGGAEGLCQKVESLMQDRLRKPQSQR
jgi:hypothetical protein